MKKIVALLLLSPQLLFASDQLGKYEWNLFGSAPLLKRELIKNKTIALQHALPYFDTKELTSQFSYKTGIELGLRAALGSEGKRKDGLEWRYLHLANEKASKSFIHKGQLTFPFAQSSYTTLFFAADRADYLYKTGYDSSELNYLSQWRGTNRLPFSLSGLIGVRYLGTNEQFAALFTKNSDTGRYQIDAKNSLLGGQVGAVLSYNVKGVGWEFGAKSALFCNRAKQHTQLIDAGDFVLRNLVTKSDHLSTLLEGHASLTANLIDLKEYRLTGKIGYQATLLSGLALAPEQIDTGTGPLAGKELHHKGEALWHGLNIGLYLFF